MKATRVGQLDVAMLFAVPAPPSQFATAAANHLVRGSQDTARLDLLNGRHP